MPGEVVLQLGEIDLAPLLRHHEGQRHLAGRVVGHADHRRVADAGMRQQRRFDFGRSDLEAR